jgi:hypothetical protein
MQSALKLLNIERVLYRPTLELEEEEEDTLTSRKE